MGVRPRRKARTRCYPAEPTTLKVRPYHYILLACHWSGLSSRLSHAPLRCIFRQQTTAERHFQIIDQINLADVEQNSYRKALNNEVDDEIDHKTTTWCAVQAHVRYTHVYHLSCVMLPTDSHTRMALSLWLVAIFRGAIAELDMLTDLLRVAKEGKLLKLERLDKPKPPPSSSLQLIVAKQGHVRSKTDKCILTLYLEFLAHYFISCAFVVERCC